MMKKTPIAVIVCLVVLPVSNYVHAQQGQKVTVSEILGERKEYYFDDNKPNELLPGFQSALTGKGEPGLWVVKKIEHAPSADNVVAQTRLDATDYRFPLLVLDGVSYKDLMISVRFLAVGGKTDQAGGLAFGQRRIPILILTTWWRRK